MLVSEKILREWIDTELNTHEIAETLTMGGIEVEEIIAEDRWLKNIVVGKILSVVNHPNADKLKVCEVLTDEKLQIVCGAPNVEKNQYVACAKPGAVLPGNLRIKPSKIRGVLSNGMLCSEKELGFSDDAKGIFVLSNTFTSRVGDPVSEVLNKNDKILNIKPTPNRADCFSVRGIARDLSAMSNSVCFTIPEGFNQESLIQRENLEIDHSVEGVSSKVCHAFASVIITGVDNQAISPDWLISKLNKFGQKSISPLVDISNYFMFVLGRPSHIFDFDKLCKENRVLEIRRGNTNEELTLLNGDDVKELEDTLVIADQTGPLALAGIMGGSSTMVTAQTSNILIESAVWLPSLIRGKARKYSLSSEAASRFEKGVDPVSLELDFKHLCNCIIKTVGGNIGKINIETYFTGKEKKINFSKKRCVETLGIEIKNEDFERIFKNLNMSLSDENLNGDIISVTPPLYRYDIEIEEDLIEEIARIFGYDAIVPSNPLGTIEPKDKNSHFKNADKIRDYLITKSYSEIIGFGFIEKGLAEKFLFPFDENINTVDVINPISVNNSTMRTSQIPGLLNVLAENYKNQQERINLFEIGNIFLNQYSALGKDNKAIIQHKVLSVIGFGPRYERQWGTGSEFVDFYDIKMLIDELSPVPLVIHELKSENTIVHPGKSGMIVPEKVKKDNKMLGLNFLEENAVGYIGELHPQLCSDMSIPSPVIICEISMNFLNQEKIISFKEIIRFPVVRRDLAFLVDKNCKVGSIRKSIASNLQNLKGCDIVKSLTPFDVYDGEDLPEGKKSITFSVVMQDTVKTLEEAETEVACSGIIALAESIEGVKFRS
tara:strand:- start:215 stop:2707 length:2493 start_codon:yes stop_codon:yes gene_type:complete